jgi:hypothetical protein
MKPILMVKNVYLVVILSAVCACVGSVLFILLVNIFVRIMSIKTGEQIHSDPTVFIFLVPFACLVLFLPVLLGVTLLGGLLRFQLHKGWLTPSVGILSGTGLWGLAVMVICFLIILLSHLPTIQPLKTLAGFTPQDYLNMIPLLLDEDCIIAIITASLVGGGVGYVLSRNLLFDRKTLLAEKKP